MVRPGRWARSTSSHESQVDVALGITVLTKGVKKVPHEEPLARISLGGFGRPGEDTVEIAPRSPPECVAPAASIASIIARCRAPATPALAMALGPTPDSTASAPATPIGVRPLPGQTSLPDHPGYRCG